ncbi:hypothetical protein IL38_24105 [Actinopolyspora erythraea]|uniref:Uncharacterized protein n=1 Tax=Actinopolyspora erythraea TaxID=414996 RepID=A0ABR4WYS7_9ACTN|nr:hypothetical protein [Actinopolyspora erythraea]KGI79383.1 hypothetical protein IL38_24105 [Actinopolyspora erythraea]
MGEETTQPIIDRLIAPVMLELRDCLCRELARTVAGPVCRCYLDHGPNPPIMDGCQCECWGTSESGEPWHGNGDGWVRLVKTDPDTGQGARSPLGAAGAAACPLGWVATLEIGAYRCVELPEDGAPPSGDTLTAMSLMLASDRAAMERTLACCDALAEASAESSGYLPARQGGCGGGTIQLRIPFTIGDPCAEPELPWETAWSISG